VIGDGLLLGPARGRYAPTEVFNVVLLKVEVEGANADASLDGAHGVLPPGRDGEPGGACLHGAGLHPTLLLLCGSAQAFAGPTQSAAASVFDGWIFGAVGVVGKQHAVKKSQACEALKPSRRKVAEVRHCPRSGCVPAGGRTGKVRCVLTDFANPTHKA
jgi:hypothetical protein